MVWTAISIFNRMHCRPASRAWLLAGAATSALALTGCVVAPMDTAPMDYGYTSTTVYTHYGYPPAPRVEYRTVAPSPHHVWVAGDWLWGGSRYHWRPGHWAGPAHRLPPPGPRPMVHSPRPQPSPPLAPPRVPVVRPSINPPPAMVAPPRAPQVRPEAGPRPQQARPDRRDPPPQARPPASRGEQARPAPPRGDRADDAQRRPPPPRERARDRDAERDERRGPQP